MNYRIFGGFLIVIAVVIFATVFYKNSHKLHEPIVYSPTFMLNALWQSYQKNYIDAQTGRTVDRQRDNVTTSEGESYTLLRAVWADDKPAFDKSWQWTKANLQRPQDNLFSWLYGQKTDGSYGILTDQGGQNTATDADTDIALSLVFASNRWHDSSYIDEAKKIIPSIWKQEVVMASGTPIVTADDIEKNAPSRIVINPSYFAPYAYKIFAQLDPQDPWQQVVDSSYNLLTQSMQQPLDKDKSAILPPNWVLLDKTTGKLLPPTATTTTTDYGFDALRTPFRLALDYQWNGDGRAKTLLEQMSFLGTQWQNSNTLFSTYSHDGQPTSATEAPAMYGGSLGYFIVADPSQAQNVYTQKLQSLYSADNQNWGQQLSYYDDNWAWFGIALYNNKLPNFYQP